MNSAQKIVFPFIQEHLVSQGAGGYDADDVAFDNALGFFGVFDLFTNSHFIAGLEHLFQIAVHGMVRDAGQRDGLAAGFAAAGEYQPQNT